MTWKKSLAKTVTTILILNDSLGTGWGMDLILISSIPVHSVTLTVNFICTVCYLLALVFLTPRTFCTFPLCLDVLLLFSC